MNNYLFHNYVLNVMFDIKLFDDFLLKIELIKKMCNSILIS